MQLHFLGGADEIGASATLVEAGGYRVLIDAGLRMGKREVDRLPNLARIDERGGVDAILVTHAHLDHTGALPLVHRAYPRAPVLLSEPTLGLLGILLRDAIKIMEQQSEREGEIPLYPLQAVESLLGRAQAVKWLQRQPLCGGALQATFFPAGHVLGASAIGLETPEGSVLLSGDISITDQLTVLGMPRPRFRPDVLVCESTYGSRLHASRRAEEQRLVDTVFETLREGGKVLIPAFALGRAQEVLLVLRRALASPGAPAVPVYVDGMVRPICGLYDQYPDYLVPALRRRAGEGRGLFFSGDAASVGASATTATSAAGGPPRIVAVRTPQDREAILGGGPAVIVASSGMLAGGPSAGYATALVSSAEALIAITGYQDEEAPGRQLQELAAGRSRELTIEGQRLPVRCRVETYGLSAHADAQELAALVAALEPRAAALVHGDLAARQDLSKLLFEGGCRQIHLPAGGDSVDFAPRPSRTRRAVPGLAGSAGGQLDEGALDVLRERLWSGPRRGRTYTVFELAEAWYGSDAVPVDLSGLESLLRGPQRAFEPDVKRPFLFRCVDPTAPTGRGHASDAGGDGRRTDGRDADGRLEQNAALALVDALLGPDSGLYRRGADRERSCLRLHFRFPDVARREHAATLATLAEQSGWQVEVNEQPHLASLEQRARELVSSLAEPTQNPSIRTDERTIRVSVAALPDPAALAGVQRRFVEETGYALQLEQRLTTPAARTKYDETGRMEINLALAAIDAAFAARPHRPHKKSKRRGERGELIELSFIAPEVGARYQDVIDELEATLFWPIRVADRVDQQAVLQAVRELLPAGWRLRKGPGLDITARQVRLRWDGAPPPDGERAAFEAALAAATGFSLAPP